MLKLYAFLKGNYLCFLGIGLVGILMGWLLPRGPLTVLSALLVLVVSLLFGALFGFKLAPKRHIIFYFVVFWTIYELTRISQVGPTVDMPRALSLYGVIALVTGRLFHILLISLPFCVGYIYGELSIRYIKDKKGARVHDYFYRRKFRVIYAFIVSVLLLGLVSLLLRPISTPLIDSENSIAELSTVTIGGKKQSILIRGQNKGNPVLLHLAGGPGGTDIGAMRLFGSELEKDFVVVSWDQRGVGKSYPSILPTNDLTLEQTVEDTVELTNHLRSRFDSDKIYLLGNSWGTTLGVLAVQQKPELYHAFIGAGQMVSQRETDRMFYEDTLTWARENNNHTLVDDLLKNGPPPYKDILHYEKALSYEHSWTNYPYRSGESEMSATLIASEYSFVDTVHSFGAFLDTFSILYPQLQDIDFRTQVTNLEVPLYLVQGKYEARGRAVLADEWFEIVTAPEKKLIEFNRSSHRPLFEEPEYFAAVMRQIIIDTKLRSEQ